ncbi:glycosyltransferase family 2 protein [Rhizobium sp. CNPSo 3464]|uniref:glycosyltransferase family 2 protein n=1 Tax=Rhizobium sp. CNPSo 3464 TaxID=3021406 RepID=UPI002551C393|nr:glycosyltransferase family 2 protein [Rhizobium sp. CNPSo 3464]MDK4741306.1 glycosyltransferase family 2 protein [Rhizobium sp. CNPSo 3464]
MTEPLVTIAVPSYNQGQFLDKALSSIFEQRVPVEVFVMDGGSTDGSAEIIEKWKPHLAGFRIHPDDGQASAINEGILSGTAQFVCWLNSDDWLLPGGLEKLMRAANKASDAPAVYGRCWNFVQNKGTRNSVWVEPFSERRLALRCFISQPATLIRRTAWEEVGGVNPNLHMTMDYDLWWRLYKQWGPLQFVDEYVAVNRIHDSTKTKTQRRLHYQEAIALVRKHHGCVPWKWWLAQPYAVWFKSIMR